MSKLQTQVKLFSFLCRCSGTLAHFLGLTWTFWWLGRSFFFLSFLLFLLLVCSVQALLHAVGRRTRKAHWAREGAVFRRTGLETCFDRCALAMSVVNEMGHIAWCKFSQHQPMTHLVHAYAAHINTRQCAFLLINLFGFCDFSQLKSLSELNDFSTSIFPNLACTSLRFCSVLVTLWQLPCIWRDTEHESVCVPALFHARGFKRETEQNKIAHTYVCVCILLAPVHVSAPRYFSIAKKGAIDRKTFLCVLLRIRWHIRGTQGPILSSLHVGTPLLENRYQAWERTHTQRRGRGSWRRYWSYRICVLKFGERSWRKLLHFSTLVLLLFLGDNFLCSINLCTRQSWYKRSLLNFFSENCVNKHKSASFVNLNILSTFLKSVLNELAVNRMWEYYAVWVTGCIYWRFFMFYRVQKLRNNDRSRWRHWTVFRWNWGRCASSDTLLIVSMFCVCFLAFMRHFRIWTCVCHYGVRELHSTNIADLDPFPPNVLRSLRTHLCTNWSANEKRRHLRLFWHIYFLDSAFCLF